MHRVVGIVAGLLALVVGAVAGAVAPPDAPAGPAREVVAARAVPTRRPAPTLPPAGPRATELSPARSTAPAAPTTTAPADPRAVRAADPVLEALVRRFLDDPRVMGHPAGVSVWVDGRGEVVSAGADQRLQPASLQKLATAAAVLERLDPAFRFTTSVTATAPISPAGDVAGDLVLVAGGDPTLALVGPHSLDELAARVAAAGVRRVEGRLVVDASRWSDDRAAPGWLDWQQPRFIGWMSALLVDGNRWPAGADAGDPALANGRRFAEALARHGIVLAGAVTGGDHPAPAGTPVARLNSADRDALVSDMLLTSDNLVAEAFVRELGWRSTGLGSPTAGAAAVADVLAALSGGAVTGGVADGSGLSRQDWRSAGEWRALLVTARQQPWWPVVARGLPVAGVSGTLRSRLGGTAAAANVAAKTGTTIESRALAGTYTAASGRTAVFAVVVNGTPADGPIGAEGAIDDLVAALVAAS